MLLCFHWNEFKYAVVFSLECIQCFCTRTNVVSLYVGMI